MIRALALLAVSAATLQAQLPAADHKQGQQDRQDRWVLRDHHKGDCYDRPIGQNRKPAAPVLNLHEFAPFVPAQRGYPRVLFGACHGRSSNRAEALSTVPSRPGSLFKRTPWR